MGCSEEEDFYSSDLASEVISNAKNDIGDISQIPGNSLSEIVENYGTPLWSEAYIDGDANESKIVIPFIEDNLITTIVYYYIFNSEERPPVVVDESFLENAQFYEKKSASMRYLSLEQKGYLLRNELNSSVQKPLSTSLLTRSQSANAKGLSDYDYHVYYQLTNNIPGDNYSTLSIDYELYTLRAIVEDIISKKFRYNLSSNFDIDDHVIKLKFIDGVITGIDWLYAVEVIDLFMREFERRVQYKYQVPICDYTIGYRFVYPVRDIDAFYYYPDFQKDLYELVAPYLEGYNPNRQESHSTLNSIATNQQIAAKQLNYLKERGGRELAELYEELLSDHSMPMRDVDKIYVAIEKSYLQLKAQYFIAIFSPQNVSAIFGLYGSIGLTPATKSRVLVAFRKWGQRFARESSTYLEPLGRGNTGRTVGRDLNEELAMAEIMSDPNKGKIINSMKPLSDPLWDGWRKMQYIHYGQDGSKIVIHYNAKLNYGRISAVDDFKFHWTQYY